ncbi:MAG: hypothetical protein J6N93_00945 [Clostridia bacterium]|nr:hypothetical protein [Clostridia bacterium]
MKGDKKAKIKVKYIVAAAIIAVFSAFYLFDYLRAKTFTVEVVSVSDENPVASNDERVEITIRVTHFGKPVEGHVIFALPSDGRMLAFTTLTDEDGVATMTYVPYTANAFLPVHDVEIRIRDQSNSVFWEINAYTDLQLKMRAR